MRSDEYYQRWLSTGRASGHKKFTTREITYQYFPSTALTSRLRRTQQGSSIEEDVKRFCLYQEDEQVQKKWRWTLDSNRITGVHLEGWPLNQCMGVWMCYECEVSAYSKLASVVLVSY